MLVVNPTLAIPLDEIGLSATRSGGPGGQHVNKTESAVQLRFDVVASASLTEDCKARLLAAAGQRANRDGVIVIKAQRHRSQDQNRDDALERLRTLVAAAAVPPKARRATRPSAGAKRRRTDEKVQRGRVKALRGPPSEG